jgi:hypothetical protein
MRHLTLVLAFIGGTITACSRPSASDDSSGATAALQRSGRWVREGDASLSALVSGIELAGAEASVTGRVFLSGRELSATGYVRGDSLVLTTTESPGLTIRGRFTGNTRLVASIEGPTLSQAIQSTFVRIP